jgi:hypothetical protein
MLLQTLSGCRVQYSVSLGTGSLGLRDRSTIPASALAPVWLSATGHRACPRVRRRECSQRAYLAIESPALLKGQPACVASSVISPIHASQ